MSGDYQLEDSVYILFTTRAFATGLPGVLSAATVAVYEDVTATPIETSIAVTETLNSINGLNAVTIAALAASGYNAGGHYHVVLEVGTVDSVSVVGEVVGHFSIESQPVNWAKVAAPTTAVDLSATDIQLVDTTTVSTDAEADIAALNNVSTADVNAQCDLALSDINLDHFVGTASGIPALPAGTYLDLLQDDGTAVYSRTTDSLQAIRDHATTIKSETALIVSDTNELQGDDVPTLIAALPTAVENRTEMDSNSTQLTAIVADTNELQGDDVPGLIATLDSVVDTVKAETVLILADTADIQPNYATESKQDIIDTNVDNLNLGIIYGAAATGTLAVGSCTSDLTGFTDDQLIGRVIIFTAGPADGEATDVLDYASASGLLTFTDLTLAPEDGNAFKIV